VLNDAGAPIGRPRDGPLLTARYLPAVKVTVDADEEHRDFALGQVRICDSINILAVLDALQADDPQPLQHVAEETLALTKMNWNNTQFDNGMPITIAAAKHVGDVLKYVPEGQEIAPRYSFYM
jgi:hypothetical protein